MNTLEKYTDEELFDILDADVEKEIKGRGYVFGWYKKEPYVGSIYILFNPAFPKLVKIGYADNVEARLKSLNRNSGLPDPFHVYATYRVKKRLEDLKVHALIDSLNPTLRHSKNKEFYELSPEKAYEILSAIAQINGDEDLLQINPLHDTFFTEPKKEEKEPQTASRKSPKPRLTFALLGIEPGTELEYIEDPSIKVITVDNVSTVNLNGENYSLSGAVTHLKQGGSWQGGEYFLYKGKKLTKIRSEIELNTGGAFPHL